MSDIKIQSLADFFRGWIIGNFEPSILKTTEFEIGIVSHKKDEVWPDHIHKVATEYNVLLDGIMLLNDQYIYPNQIFIIEPNIPSRVKFLKDCRVLVVKVPSVPGDKYELKS